MFSSLSKKRGADQISSDSASPVDAKCESAPPLSKKPRTETIEAKEQWLKERTRILSSSPSDSRFDEYLCCHQSVYVSAAIGDVAHFELLFEISKNPEIASDKDQLGNYEDCYPLEKQEIERCLCIAACRNQTEIVSYLISSFEVLSFVSNSKALLYACENGRVDVFRALLGGRRLSDCAGQYELTPEMLHVAVTKDHSRIIEELLSNSSECGSIFDPLYERGALFYIAADKNLCRVVYALLKNIKKFNPTFPDDSHVEFPSWNVFRGDRSMLNHYPEIGPEILSTEIVLYNTIRAAGKENIPDVLDILLRSFSNIYSRSKQARAMGYMSFYDILKATRPNNRMTVFNKIVDSLPLLDVDETVSALICSISGSVQYYRGRSSREFDDKTIFGFIQQVFHSENAYLKPLREEMKNVMFTEIFCNERNSNIISDILDCKEIVDALGARAIFSSMASHGRHEQMAARLLRIYVLPGSSPVADPLILNDVIESGSMVLLQCYLDSGRSVTLETRITNGSTTYPVIEKLGSKKFSEIHRYFLDQLKPEEKARYSGPFAQMVKFCHDADSIKYIHSKTDVLSVSTLRKYILIDWYSTAEALAFVLSLDLEENPGSYLAENYLISSPKTRLVLWSQSRSFMSRCFEAKEGSDFHIDHLCAITGVAKGIYELPRKPPREVLEMVRHCVAKPEDRKERDPAWDQSAFEYIERTVSSLIGDCQDETLLEANADLIFSVLKDEFLTYRYK